MSSSSDDDVSAIAARPRAVAGLRFVVAGGLTGLALDAGAFLCGVLIGRLSMVGALGLLARLSRVADLVLRPADRVTRSVVMVDVVVMASV